MGLDIPERHLWAKEIRELALNHLSLSQQCWTLWDDGFLAQSLNEASDWIHSGKWISEDVSSGGWFWIRQKDKGSAA
jgi:hypothetical protein